LGYLGRSSKPEWIEKDLPETVDEMDYELYPKNGDEVWDSYKKYSQELDFTYDDDLILESIKRTHHIVHNRVEDFQPDTEVRLPDFLVPEGKTDAQALVEACIAGLKEFNLHTTRSMLIGSRKSLRSSRSEGSRSTS
jgi:hypothetical protein